MKTAFRTAGLLASAAFVLTAAGSALAADPPGKPVKVEREVIIKRGGPDGGMRWQARNPEAKAQKLRDILQLRPDQEPALQAFIAATAPPTHMKMMDGPPDGKGAGKPGDMPMRKAMTTPERLDMQARMMAHHQAAFEKRAAAIKTFYAALSPSQQKAFDALHAGRMGGMGGHGMKVMRMGGPEGGPPGGMAIFESDDVDE